MPTFYDSKGVSHVLTEQIGSGGEGTVYVCPHDFELVAKIYHEPPTDEKAEKLRWMADNQNDRLLKVAAWIVDTLHDQPDGKTVGFLMPNVKAKEIHELYSLKSRRVYFPDATWKFLVHTAANLARAFYNLHKSGHIMGDINQGNCVVLADGTVKLIDCDSYSITRGDYRYPCEVGVATHLAPELQKVNLRDAKREVKHDNFGLAVIVFQLLFLGRHPFAGNFLGDDDKSLEDCIREKRFAYGDGTKERWIKQPPGTLALSAVSPRIALMLERAFLTEDRPAPDEWIEALEDLSANLKQCAVHPGHHFFNDLTACPWCEIEAKTGLMLFPFTSEKVRADGEEHFDIFTVETLIASLNLPQNSLSKSSPNALQLSIAIQKNPPPAPSQSIVSERGTHNGRIFILTAAQFFIIVAGSIIFGTGFAFLSGVIVLIFGLVYLTNCHKSIKDSAEYDLESARTEWKKHEHEYERFGAGAHLEKDLTAINKKIADYKNFQNDSREQMKHLRDELFRYKLDLYLKSFKIANAKIPGVENAKPLLLRSLGISTAADVEAKTLHALPAVSHAIAENLLDWRENLERNFDYDQSQELPEADRRRFSGEIAVKQRLFEKEIQSIFVGLRSGAAVMRQKQQQLSGKAEAVAAKIAQAESDIRLVGNNAAAFAALFLTTFVTLGIGAALTHNNHSDSDLTISSGETNNRKTRAETVNNVPPTVNNAKPDLPDNLTDQEIAAMSDADKTKMANRISDQVNSLAAHAKTYDEHTAAERKMRLAVRLAPNDSVILTQLGDVLYDEKKFPQSLEVLQKSLKLDAYNVATKSSLGMTYLRVEKYSDALKIFTELAQSNPDSAPWQFNLGLAYKGLKKYKSALEKFQTADKLVSNDVATQNEINFCERKLGIKVQYQSATGSGEGNGSGSGVGSGSGISVDSPPPPPPPPMRIGTN